MKVVDIMTRDVVTTEEATPFKDVVSLLIEHAISSVPVLDPAGFLVGLVTEADLLSKEAYPEGRSRRALTLLAEMLGGKEIRWLARADGLTAGDIMSLDITSVAPGTDVQTAARLMLEGSVTQLPVLEDGRLVGIVARRDLLRVFVRPDKDVIAEVNQRLGELSELGHDVRASIDSGIIWLEGHVLQAGQEDVVSRAIEGVPGVVYVQSNVTVRHGAG